jgi:hypothetical protein
MGWRVDFWLFFEFVVHGVRVCRWGPGRSLRVAGAGWKAVGSEILALPGPSSLKFGFSNLL